MAERLLAVLLFSAVFAPCASAHGSGLGKFVQGTSENQVRECRTPDAPEGLIPNTRFSVLGGSSRAFEDTSVFSIYGDLGYRLASTTGGCRSSGGMLPIVNWWWHSLILGIDAELIPSQIDDSPVGLMLTYDLKRQTRGFLKELSYIARLGGGLSVGPHYSAGEWGVGAALFLRAMFDFRFGVDYDFGRGFAASLHVGITDPHLIVWKFLND